MVKTEKGFNQKAFEGLSLPAGFQDLGLSTGVESSSNAIERLIGGETGSLALAKWIGGVPIFNKKLMGELLVQFQSIGELSPDERYHILTEIDLRLPGLLLYCEENCPDAIRVLLDEFIESLDEVTAEGKDELDTIKMMKTDLISFKETSGIEEFGDVLIYLFDMSAQGSAEAIMYFRSMLANKLYTKAFQETDNN